MASVTVVSGDTLSELMLKHAPGTALTRENFEKVARANGIADPNLIHPGQKIDFSVLQQGAQPPAAPTPTAQPNGGGQQAIAQMQPLDLLSVLLGQFPANNNRQSLSAFLAGVDPNAANNFGLGASSFGSFVFNLGGGRFSPYAGLLG